MRGVIALIMAGGKGERLFPLTADRTKPAVPFGGSYRIIDIVLSNCINSGIYKIMVLPQYKGQSLVDHLEAGWNIFSWDLGHYLRIVSPQMRTGKDWYRGTADSVRQNLYLIERDNASQVLILSGDHIYKMNYTQFWDYHVAKGGVVTLSVVEAPISEAHRFGIVEVDENFRVIGFKEKPKDPKTIPGDPEHVLVSMGIYLFQKGALIDVLKGTDQDDFGKDIIPEMIDKYPVYAYSYKKKNKIKDYVYTTSKDGDQVKVLVEQTRDSSYWRDVGDLDAYWNANMDLTGVDPIFNLYGQYWPLRTLQTQLPPVKTVFKNRGEKRVGMMLDSMVSHGSIISGGTVTSSILSSNVLVRSWAEIRESVIMSNVVIGRHSRIMKAIIDKDNNIPAYTEIGYNPSKDRERFVVTPRGISVVRKGMFR
ncbi:MAG: glucose-1-phosphate adenylyltransferase [Proteobacteria bacterium]|nr:glucose-1-phosphate adenylyltransferase [Pseudomonadota bacterium]